MFLASDKDASQRGDASRPAAP